MAATISSEASVDEGLEAFYPFDDDDDATGTVVDASGHGQHGTAEGVTRVVGRDGRPKSAYEFNGNGHIRLPGASTTGKAAGTISLWLKTAGPTPTNQECGRPDLPDYRPFGCQYNIFGKRDAANTSPLRAQLGGPLDTGPDQFSFRVAIGSELWTERRNWSFSAWHLYTFVWSPEATEIYFDAVRVATRAGGIVSIAGDLYLGTHGLTLLAERERLRGWIDDVRIYARALSGAEVAELFNPNAAPVARLRVPSTTAEGTPITLDASGSTDPDGDALMFAWDLDGDGEFDDATASAVTHTFPDNGNYTVRLKVTDVRGASSTTSVGVTVENAVPVVGSVAVPIGPIPAGTSVTVSAAFSDAGVADTHTGAVQWGNGEGFVPAMPGIDQSGRTLTATNTMLAAGVYTVWLQVTDDDGGAGTGTATSYVVIYDPNAGFVTGGGWILSPEGACAPTVCGYTGQGRASFGFLSKYQPGATKPSGSTEFQFQAGDLRFRSTSYDWLVVAGARAQYKGEGTVNGAAGYHFLITAIDGAANRSPDRFRIKIWNAQDVVYDNQRDQEDDSDATTALGGGSIVIQRW